jgi:hypothetical protein
VRSAAKSWPSSNRMDSGTSPPLGRGISMSITVRVWHIADDASERSGWSPARRLRHPTALGGGGAHCVAGPGDSRTACAWSGRRGRRPLGRRLGGALALLAQALPGRAPGRLHLDRLDTGGEAPRRHVDVDTLPAAGADGAIRSSQPCASIGKVCSAGPRTDRLGLHVPARRDLLGMVGRFPMAVVSLPAEDGRRRRPPAGPALKRLYGNFSRAKPATHSRQLGLVRIPSLGSAQITGRDGRERTAALGHAVLL